MGLSAAVRNSVAQFAAWIFLPIECPWLKIITCYCYPRLHVTLFSRKGFPVLPRTGPGRREDRPLSSRRRAFVLPRACLCFPEGACQCFHDVLECVSVDSCFCLLIRELCLPVRDCCFFRHAYFYVLMDFFFVCAEHVCIIGCSVFLFFAEIFTY